jgi:pyridoxal phosphate enzyme (YggS family)
LGSIAENIARVRAEIARAAVDANRDPNGITLVAVAKTKPREAIEEALAAGQTVFGENRVQEAEEKYVPPLPGAELHMVGHLQSNKAKTAAALFDRIHSIDSLKIARSLERHLADLGRTMKALVQVNLGQEPQKSGVDERETAALLRELAKLDRLEVDGLMVLPPFFNDPELTRPYFVALHELRARLSGLDIGGIELKHLSMGMTADYQVAIAEGATIVRVGTAIFGDRA